MDYPRGRSRYEQLLAEVADAIGPADFIDWLLVKDFVAHTWEIQRSRQHRETVIWMGRLKALQQILDQAMPPDAEGFRSGRNGDITNLAIEWLHDEFEAAKRVADTLQASGFSLAEIAAHAITVMAVELERIDLQVERHESRRDSLVRQIERRRNVKAEFLERYEGAQPRGANSQFRLSRTCSQIRLGSIALVRDGVGRTRRFGLWFLIRSDSPTPDPERSLI